MATIIDKIKLLNSDLRDDFENWVKEVDYLACHDLKSVKAFSVHKVNTVANEYVEIVHVTSIEDFQSDMKTELFQSLAEKFSTLAEVTETIECELIPPGYIEK